MNDLEQDMLVLLLFLTLGVLCFDMMKETNTNDMYGVVSDPQDMEYLERLN